MTEAERTEVQSKIVASLRKLIVADSQNGLGEMWIESGIGLIMVYADSLQSELELNWFSPLGYNKVREEVEKMVSIYKKLADKMNRAHQPTHEILSHIGAGPFFERTRCENLIQALETIVSSDEFSRLPKNP
jgi:hypothetical protein